MKNIEKWNNLEEVSFKDSLNKLEEDLKKNKNETKKEHIEKDDVSQKKELLTLEQEIINKYEEYDSRMKEKTREKEENLSNFKRVLKKLKWNIDTSKAGLEDRKPQLDVYTYAKKNFDNLEQRFGRKKVLNLIENIIVSWLEPRRDDEKWAADKWRVDAILALYDWTPDIIANLLF